MTDTGSAPPIALGAFGTCRVQVPMGLMADQGRLSFEREPIIGYLHNALEMTQAIRLLRGGARPPDWLAPLMAITAYDQLGSEDRRRRTLEEVEMLVVEVSSIRSIHYDGWELQINGLRELLNPLGIDERTVGGLFRKKDGRQKVLDTLTDGAHIDLARDVVGRARFTELDEEAAYRAVRELREAIDRPTLFVGFMSAHYDGHHIPQRLIGNTALARVAAEVPDTFYCDPTRLVARMGPREVLKDLGHYTPEFEPLIARFLMKRISRVASAARG